MIANRVLTHIRVLRRVSLNGAQERKRSDWKCEAHFEEELRVVSGRFELSSSCKSIPWYTCFVLSSLN